ncbi:MAG TPA: YraN family protein [Gallionella sp.]
MTAGAQAEQWAVQYLAHQGLRLVEQNYRSRFGEIDLIMRDGEVLVFVEVHMRRNAGYGGAAASIDAHKQQRIIRTAQQYLAGLARTL